MDDVLVFFLAMKDCNVTTGPSSMVSTLLVFGEVTRIPARSEELTTKRKHMEALQAVVIQIKKLVAKLGLNIVLNQSVTSATDKNVKIGGVVLVFRDNTGRWEGPFKVIDKDEKIVRADHYG